MNNPFDYTPDAACEQAFRELIVKIESLKKSDCLDNINFCRELEDGKMLGVLIASDSCGVLHALYAFSGQLGNGGFYHPGFVGPVFDYLQPDGYFKTKEADISRLNSEISRFKNGPFSKIKSDYERTKQSLEAEVAEYKEKCRLSKFERDTKRESGITDEDEIAAMIRQSQFEKAELHRLKKRMAANLEPFAAILKNAQSHLDSLKEKRRTDSENLQQFQTAQRSRRKQEPKRNLRRHPHEDSSFRGRRMLCAETAACRISKRLASRSNRRVLARKA